MANEDERRHYFGEVVEISGVGDDKVLVRRYDSISRGPVVSVTIRDADDQPTQAWLSAADAVKVATALLNVAEEARRPLATWDAILSDACPECGGVWVEHGGGRRSRKHEAGCSVGR